MTPRLMMNRLLDALRQKPLDEEFDEEIQAHLEMAVEDYILHGLSAEEAEAAARRDFGHVERAKERHRDVRGFAAVDHIARHIRFGLFSFRRRPGLAAVAVLTLALGIGATSAVFSVVNGVLLKPLSYERLEDLVAVWLTAPGAPTGSEGQLSPGEALYFTAREEGRAFEEIGLWNTHRVAIARGPEPEAAVAASVTPDVFPLFRVAASYGRLFRDADAAPAAAPTAVLDYGYWLSRFGGDPTVVGNDLRVDGTERRIIGVLPAGFSLPERRADIYLPHQWDPARTIFTVSFTYRAVARLAPDVTLEQASAELARLIPVSVEQFPGGMKLEGIEMIELGPNLRPLKDDVVGDVGNALWVLLGGVALVFLIACANVANLFLVRAEERRREIAVRSAIGASRSQVAAQLFAESAVYGLTGGAIGLLLTISGVRLLKTLDPGGIPRLEEVGLHPPVFAFTFATSLLAGLLFGLLPVIRVGRQNLATALRDGGRTGSQDRRRRVNGGIIVVCQTALVLVLLVAAGLMIRSFLALRAVDVGFAEPAELLTFRVRIPEAQIADPREVALTYERISHSLQAIPGVASVGASSSVTMDGANRTGLIWIENGALGLDELPPVTRIKWITEGYFETMGIPLVVGRSISWSDIRDDVPVGVVTENFARLNFGTAAAALGRRVTTGDPARPAWREIVGVVGDIRNDGVDLPAPPVVYWPLTMLGYQTSGLFVSRSMIFALRVESPSSSGSEVPAGDPFGTLAAAQQAVWSVNPSLPLSDVQTMEGLVERSMARTSFMLSMLLIAATVALGLGVVGIYGVVSNIVSVRRREIGIRMSLGASPLEVGRMILREGMVLAGIGIAIGLTVAIALSRQLSSLLYGIDGPAHLRGGCNSRYRRFDGRCLCPRSPRRCDRSDEHSPPRLNRDPARMTTMYLTPPHGNRLRAAGAPRTTKRSHYRRLP
ncbi:MAG: FtsX-like permease family protein [Gemmatimonas sp.]|nr:FtsX-like permease family protein [Gemmatimonas sp.]